eukprot:TRINITY_DN123846_c0_g1_i1.p1 TRINITY_DN123846_c0_g1~~TRINITY_DN123846_c0_g1_i1.p1  ORF type:complete len:157 (-),score=16.90 TRINITY_DN123846_c0_g1_i1:116-586(-)
MTLMNPQLKAAYYEPISGVGLPSRANQYYPIGCVNEFYNKSAEFSRCFGTGTWSGSGGAPESLHQSSFGRPGSFHAGLYDDAHQRRRQTVSLPSLLPPQQTPKALHRGPGSPRLAAEVRRHQELLVREKARSNDMVKAMRGQVQHMSTKRMWPSRR